MGDLDWWKDTKDWFSGASKKVQSWFDTAYKKVEGELKSLTNPDEAKKEMKKFEKKVANEEKTLTKAAGGGKDITESVDLGDFMSEASDWFKSAEEKVNQ